MSILCLLQTHKAALEQNYLTNLHTNRNLIQNYKLIKLIIFVLYQDSLINPETQAVTHRLFIHNLNLGKGKHLKKTRDPFTYMALIIQALLMFLTERTLFVLRQVILFLFKYFDFETAGCTN
jgi:hypothetical protein